MPGKLEKREAFSRRCVTLLLGKGEKPGLLLGLFRYVLLTAIAFVFVYPILYMVSLSLMPEKDLMDVSVRWLPSSLTLTHYRHAWTVLNYSKNLPMTLCLVFVTAALQTASTALVGYGFARFDFPLKKLWMGILLLSYLLPTQVTALPNYVLFQQLRLSDGSIKPFVVTCLLGQGLNSGLCVLIFYSFHRQAPRSLLEAAEIDGASALRTFISIAMPMAMAGVIVVSVFTVIWYWNELYIVETYIGYQSTGYDNKDQLTTLMLQMARFGQAYEIRGSNAIDSPDKLNAAKSMAGTMLTVLPLLIMYAFVQKKFVSSIDSAGITGE